MFFMVTVFLCGCIFLNSCARIDPEENEIFEERKESFEKDKGRLKETLFMTNAHELAGEVEKHINSPSNEEEANGLIENITETISCIQLEKSGVEQGIADMEN